MRVTLLLDTAVELMVHHRWSMSVYAASPGHTEYIHAWRFSTRTPASTATPNRHQQILAGAEGVGEGADVVDGTGTDEAGADETGTDETGGDETGNIIEEDGVVAKGHITAASDKFSSSLGEIHPRESLHDFTRQEICGNRFPRGRNGGDCEDRLVYSSAHPGDACISRMNELPSGPLIGNVMAAVPGETGAAMQSNVI